MTDKEGTGSRTRDREREERMKREMERMYRREVPGNRQERQAEQYGRRQEREQEGKKGIENRKTEGKEPESRPEKTAGEWGGSGDSVTPLKQRSHTASKRLRKLDCDTTRNRMFHKNRRREFADFGQILSLTLLGPFDSIFNAPRERSTKNTERYRSGHNEAVLKTVCPSGRMGSNPILSAQTFLQQAIEYRIFDSGIFGEIPKWPKGLPWKGSRSLIAARGFKSLFLR